MRLLLVFLILTFSMKAQNNNSILPFSEISKEKEDYTSINIISRLIEGVAYRYYWASNGLKPIDLKFKPSPTSISTYETLEHRPNKNIPKTYKELRRESLNNFKIFNDNILNKSENDLQKMKIIFERNGRETSFPFWNLLNGQIADIIYHTGQIVSFRRTTGNPIQKGVNAFLGKTRKID